MNAADQLAKRRIWALAGLTEDRPQLGGHDRDRLSRRATDRSDLKDRLFHLSVASIIRDGSKPSSLTPRKPHLS